MNIKTRICNVVQQRMEPYLKVQSLVAGRQHMCTDLGNICFSLLCFYVCRSVTNYWDCQSNRLM